MWRERIKSLGELPPHIKNLLSSNVEQEISALYHEYKKAQKERDASKQQRVLRRFRWINNRLLEIAQNAEYGVVPPRQALTFPQGRIHENLLLKFLVIAIGVTYYVLKNLYWESAF